MTTISSPAVEVSAERYEMPTCFGPSLLPETSSYRNVVTALIPFRTERAMVEAFVPSFFRVADDPWVTVVHQMMQGVDYLAGRDYNLIRVGVSAEYHDAGGEIIKSTFPLIVWESDTNPIIAGREIAGTPKVFAEVSDLREFDGSRSFTCSEYGTPLLTGEVRGLVPMSADDVKKVHARTSVPTVVSFSHKYIPLPSGGHEVSHGTTVDMSFECRDGFFGVGEVHFHSPSWEQAPVASRVLEALRRIPNLGYGKASVTTGPAKLFRNACRTLV